MVLGHTPRRAHHLPMDTLLLEKAERRVDPINTQGKLTSICHQASPASSGTWGISAWKGSFDRGMPAHAAFFLETGRFPMPHPTPRSLVLNVAAKISDVHFWGAC